MIDISPEVVTLLMFGLMLGVVILGCHLAWALAGIALFVGLLAWGPDVFGVFYGRVFGLITTFPLVAVPTFIFMGMMVERTGIAERLFEALYLWMGGMRGGLAVATIVVSAIMATTVGVVAASVVTVGIIALPSMVRRGYDKALATGSICAGGTLGILIPPSVMLIFYGPAASLSVGKLFMAAFFPGFLLAGLYVAYITVFAFLNPAKAPSMPVEERRVPASKKFKTLATSLLPPMVLLLGVLGSIFLGIVSPSEAGGLGALISIIMALAYRSLSLKKLMESLLQTFRIMGMAFAIAASANIFTGVFMALGCGAVVQDFALAAPFGKWGAFVILQLIVFLLGFILDWLGILLVMVPIMTPIVAAVGFDPIWFAMMVCLNLQTSFMTPPLAYSIYFIKGICKPEWKIEITDIMRGVWPFIAMVLVAIGLCIVFPQIILWLPNQMIKPW